MNTDRTFEQASESPHLADLLEMLRPLLTEIASELRQMQSDGIAEQVKVFSDKTNDVVTAGDLHCEQRILEVLQRQCPTHRLQGEESGTTDHESAYEWNIDPIDGTVNYRTGHPNCGISVGLRRNGEPILGIIHFIANDEQFFAAEGQGAFHVSHAGATPELLCVKADNVPASLATSVIAFDVGYENGPYGNRESQLRIQRLLANGSRYATMDACFLTSVRSVLLGHRVAYVNPGPGIHDVAASAIIAKEAGAVVAGLDGAPLVLDRSPAPTIIAINHCIKDQIVQLIASA